MKSEARLRGSMAQFRVSDIAGLLQYVTICKDVWERVETDLHDVADLSDDVASDNEWFIDDETDLPLSDLQLEDLSVNVLRGEADQAGTSTSITPNTSTSSAAQQENKDTIGEEDSLEDPFSDGT
ncbi:hypothetical protein M5K25_013276 [Dendrobium thyrsiflorum]|uniref:Uncharacterized protein n=1 Tax=Dendrobium thyrsiflorum TaxID=117978 RepID=A0ABD0UZQ3_DENTH